MPLETGFLTFNIFDGILFKPQCHLLDAKSSFLGFSREFKVSRGTKSTDKLTQQKKQNQGFVVNFQKNMVFLKLYSMS